MPINPSRAPRPGWGNPRTRVLVLAIVAALVGGGPGCSSAAASLTPGATGGHRVLFIGNSLTYVNDLPRTLSDLAASVGDTIVTARVAFPNFSLEDHAHEGSARKAIALGGWEYVVMQQGPSSRDDSRANLIEWSRHFDGLIRAVNARPALYMVWPDAASRAVFGRVDDSYRLAAESVDGLFLPAGRAWCHAWEADATLSLYASDDFHPSPLGTYTAAAEIYERITGHDARALPARAVVDGRTLGAPEATVRLLQRAAHQANVDVDTATPGLPAC